MTKLCLLGNSHLSALRMGWPKVTSAFPSCQIDFFGAAHNNLRSLEPVGRSLITKDEAVLRQFRMTASGKDKVNLDDYDGFVICLGLGLSFLVTGLEGFRPIEMADAPGNPHLTSHAVLDLTIKRSMLKGGAMLLARKIRALTNAPIIACAIPVPTLAVLETESAAWHDIELLRPVIEPKWKRVADFIERGVGMTVLPQPEETLERGLTAERFSRGYIRLKDNLDSADTCDDNKHMNGEYGAIVLHQVMQTHKRIGSTQQSIKRFVNRMSPKAKSPIEI